MMKLKNKNQSDDIEFQNQWKKNMFEKETKQQQNHHIKVIIITIQNQKQNIIVMLKAILQIIERILKIFVKKHGIGYVGYFIFAFFVLLYGESFFQLEILENIVIRQKHQIQYM